MKEIIGMLGIVFLIIVMVEVLSIYSSTSSQIQASYIQSILTMAQNYPELTSTWGNGTLAYYEDSGDQPVCIVGVVYFPTPYAQPFVLDFNYTDSSIPAFASPSLIPSKCYATFLNVYSVPQGSGFKLLTNGVVEKGKVLLSPGDIIAVPYESGSVAFISSTGLSFYYPNLPREVTINGDQIEKSNSLVLSKLNTTLNSVIKEAENSFYSKDFSYLEVKVYSVNNQGTKSPSVIVYLGNGAHYVVKTDEKILVDQCTLVTLVANTSPCYSFSRWGGIPSKTLNNHGLIETFMFKGQQTVCAYFNQFSPKTFLNGNFYSNVSVVFEWPGTGAPIGGYATISNGGKSLNISNNATFCASLDTKLTLTPNSFCLGLESSGGYGSLRFTPGVTNKLTHVDYHQVHCYESKTSKKTIKYDIEKEVVCYVLYDSALQSVHAGLIGQKSSKNCIEYCFVNEVCFYFPYVYYSIQFRDIATGQIVNASGFDNTSLVYGAYAHGPYSGVPRNNCYWGQASVFQNQTSLIFFDSLPGKQNESTLNEFNSTITAIPGAYFRNNTEFSWMNPVFGTTGTYPFKNDTCISTAEVIQCGVTLFFRPIELVKIKANGEGYVTSSFVNALSGKNQTLGINPYQCAIALVPYGYTLNVSSDSWNSHITFSSVTVSNDSPPTESVVYPVFKKFNPSDVASPYCWNGTVPSRIKNVMNIKEDSFISIPILDWATVSVQYNGEETAKIVLATNTGGLLTYTNGTQAGIVVTSGVYELPVNSMLYFSGAPYLGNTFSNWSGNITEVSRTPFELFNSTGMVQSLPNGPAAFYVPSFTVVLNSSMGITANFVKIPPALLNYSVKLTFNLPGNYNVTGENSIGGISYPIDIAHSLSDSDSKSQTCSYVDLTAGSMGSVLVTGFFDAGSNYNTGFNVGLKSNDKSFYSCTVSFTNSPSNNYAIGNISYTYITGYYIGVIYVTRGTMVRPAIVPMFYGTDYSSVFDVHNTASAGDWVLFFIGLLVQIVLTVLSDGATDEGSFNIGGVLSTFFLGADITDLGSTTEDLAFDVMNSLSKVLGLISKAVFYASQILEIIGEATNNVQLVNEGTYLGIVSAFVGVASSALDTGATSRQLNGVVQEVEDETSADDLSPAVKFLKNYAGKPQKIVSLISDSASTIGTVACCVYTFKSIASSNSTGANFETGVGGTITQFSTITYNSMTTLTELHFSSYIPPVISVVTGPLNYVPAYQKIGGEAPNGNFCLGLALLQGFSMNFAELYYFANGYNEEDSVSFVTNSYMISPIIAYSNTPQGIYEINGQCLTMSIQ
ncbi:hypothetical protein HS7_15480 [Sulfolobales archaeon HS-7]|nr:hypothetical protein HS7_15480 [Sulfolobales archaeon HS-7]